MTDRWTDRLSEYLDGHLDAREARELEVHLAECRECPAALATLRDVTARAATLAPLPPERDLWPAIAARLEPRHAREAAPGFREALRSLVARRLTFSLPQLAAASLALVLVTGGGAWMALRGRPDATPQGPIASQPAPLPGASAVGLEQYDMAIADLERVLADRRADLDSSTVRVVERNLAAIDVAIADARRALAADPANPYLNDHLATTMRRKMGLLRRVTAAAFST